MLRLAPRTRLSTLRGLGGRRGLPLSPSSAATALRWRPQPAVSLPAAFPALPRNTYYTPPQFPPGYPAYPQPEPKKWRHRIRDMVLGGLLTLAIYVAVQYVEVRQLKKKIKEVLVLRKRDDDLFDAICAAREAGDATAVRELTFEKVRNITRLKDESHVWTELGPLPSFPLGDDRCGQDLVPESETLMLVQRVPPDEDGDEGVTLTLWGGSGSSSKNSGSKAKDDPEKWPVHTLLVGVNMEIDESKLAAGDNLWLDQADDDLDGAMAMERRIAREARDAVNSGDEVEARVVELLRDAWGLDRRYRPHDARLRELFDRVEYQIRKLAQRGDIDSQGRVWVGLSLQERSRIFDYNFRDGFCPAEPPGQDL